MRQVLLRGSYGDAVLLHLIAANCDLAQFAALVRHLVNRILRYLKQKRTLVVVKNSFVETL